METIVNKSSGTMRAYSVMKFGESAGIHNLPIPSSESDLLVRVTYAGVNPVDYKLIERLTAASYFPYIIGVDFAGIIERIPSGELNFKIGDRIFGQARSYGTYAEYTMVTPGLNTSPFAHIPDGISDEQAAALPVAAITSLGSLNLLNVTAGQSLVVMGAIGGVGGYALEMARSRGLKVIATVRGDSGGEAYQLGAEEVYNINEVDVFKAIRSNHPEGVDAILDLVNGPNTIIHNTEILKPGGNLVSAIYAADIGWFAERRINAFNIASNTNPISSQQGLNEIAKMLAEGKITARIRSTVDLDKAGTLHDKIKHGGLRGKSVIRI